MTSLASTFQTAALSLLTQFGESCTFTRVVPGTYNTTTGSSASGTTTTYTAYVTPSQSFALNIANTVTGKETSQLTMYHATYVPLVGDSVLYNGITYNINKVSPSRVDGSSVLYLLDIGI